MNTGDRVFHRQLGWGTIQRIIQQGLKKVACVDFGYIKDLFRTDELATTEEAKSPPLEKNAGSKDSEIQNGNEEGTRLISASKDVKPPSLGTQPCEVGSQTEARRGVVALRLGQILESQIFQLSVGTGQLEARLASLVEKATRQELSFILVEGVWGGGKTHALTLLQAIARRAGFTTSSVVMDGLALALSEPMQLMEEILSALVFPKDMGSQSLGDLMRNVVKSGKIPALKTKGASDIANLLEKVPMEVFDDAEALGHIQDYFSLSLSATQAKQKLKQLGYNASRLPTIRVIRVEERTHAFCVLMRNWANLVSGVGFRGMLVVLDELDVEYASTAYADQVSAGRRERRKQLMLQMKEMTKQRAPLIIAFASAPAGGDITPEHDAVEDILRIFGGAITHVKVPVPNQDELIKLFEKLNGIYSQAYPCSKELLTQSCLGSIMDNLLCRHRRELTSIPRQFVRSAIEALDLFALCEKPFDEFIGLIGSKE